MACGTVGHRRATTGRSGILRRYEPLRGLDAGHTTCRTFPQFMDGVLEGQLDDTHLHWRAEIGGKEEQWEAEITEQTPDRVIAWRSTSGAHNAGRVNFQPMGAKGTRIQLRIDHEPRDMTEKIGDAIGPVGGKVSGNLQRFKKFIEGRGVETGAWRGSVGGGEAHGAR